MECIKGGGFLAISNEWNMSERVESISDELINWRRKIHAQPELSFNEIKTSNFVANKLSSIQGMHVQTEVGYPTAVVGELTNGVGPVIALRADMDALPITEENTHSFKSQNEGVMHACGHDAHTAILLGVASILGALFAENKLHGTVKFLFQPAEETADDNGSTGAPYMIKAGALKNVEATIALHMSPEHDVGEILMNDGYSMAYGDVFHANVYGTGGHGAYPQLGTDPIWMLSPVLHALYTIANRRIDPLEPATISIGTLKAGSTSNIIPSEVEMKGTIRSYNPTTRLRLHEEVENAFSMIQTLGGFYHLTIKSEDPSLYNSPYVNAIIRKSIHSIDPTFVIINKPFGLGGEDFAHMTREVPGAMFFLGCKKSNDKVRNLHTPTFDINEDCLPVGVSILLDVVRRFLMEHK